MDDLQLWSKLKAGDQKALKEIYDRHVVDLENYCRKFTKETELIEDSIHDVFIQIWNKRETLGMTDSIVKYLCVTVRRELIRKLNKADKTSSFTEINNVDVGFSISIEDLIIEDETLVANKEKLAESFKLLSHRQREAIYLKYYEEMSYEDICGIMDINYQSVRNLISKGILALRENIIQFLILFFILF